MPTMALYLNFTSPTQQKEVAKGAIATATYLDMQAPLQHIRQKASQESPSRVVVYISYHRLTMPFIEANGIVIAVVKKGTLDSSDKGVVLLPLFM